MLLEDIRRTDLFILDLLEQIQILQLIKKRREEEELIVALILADEL
jgi:hypothetical protein